MGGMVVALMPNVANAALPTNSTLGFLDEPGGRFALAMLIMVGLAIIGVIVYCFWYARKQDKAEKAAAAAMANGGAYPMGMQMQGVMVPPPLMQQGTQGPGQLFMPSPQKATVPTTTPSAHHISHSQTAHGGLDPVVEPEMGSKAAAEADTPTSMRPRPLTTAPSSPGLHRIMSRKLAEPTTANGSPLAASTPVTPRGIRDYRRQLAENPTQSFQFPADADDVSARCAASLSAHCTALTPEPVSFAARLPGYSCRRRVGRGRE